MDPEKWREDVSKTLARIETITVATNGTVKDHEKRIRKLEYVAWSAWPALAAIAAWLRSHIMGGK